MFRISKIKLSLSLSVVLLISSITACQSVSSLLTPTATTPADVPATPISTGEIISPTTSTEVTEPSPTQTPISPTNTPTSITTPNPAQDLYIYTEGPREDIYILKGSKFTQYTEGDDLVVYGEITPGTPIVIALLEVIAKNPDSLSAQVLLIHPSFPVRTNLRVDSKLDYISESELIPSPEFALGYLLRPGRIRLRPDSGVKENSVLQALDFEIVGGVQLDALPFVPAIKMLVQAVGAEGNIASVELIEGNWPITGTIVSGVIVGPTPLSPTPTATYTPIPTETPTATFTPVSTPSSTSTPTNIPIPAQVAAPPAQPDESTNPVGTPIQNCTLDVGGHSSVLKAEPNGSLTIGHLPSGQYSAQRRSGNWFYIESDSQSGWVDGFWATVSPACVSESSISDSFGTPIQNCTLQVGGHSSVLKAEPNGGLTIGSLSSGEYLAQRQSGNWFYIESDGQKGWVDGFWATVSPTCVSESSISNSFGTPIQNCTLQVSGHSSVLKAEPNGVLTIGSLPGGQYSAQRRSGNWFYIEGDGQSGWVDGFWATVSPTCAN